MKKRLINIPIFAGDTGDPLRERRYRDRLPPAGSFPCSGSASDLENYFNVFVDEGGEFLAVHLNPHIVAVIADSVSHA